MQSDKQLLIKRAEEAELLNTKTNADIQRQIQKTKDLIDTKRQMLNELSEEMVKCEIILNDKNKALEELLKSKIELEKRSSLLLKHKENIESSIAKVKENYINLERDTTNQWNYNEKLKKETKIINAKIADIDGLKVQIAGEIRIVEDDLIKAEQRKEDKERLLRAIAKEKELNDNKIGELNVANAELNKKNYDLKRKTISMESLLSKIIDQYDKTLIILNNYDKELKQTKVKAEVLQSKSLEANNELTSLRKSNEDLQKILEQHKESLNFQKNLRDIQALKKIELEKERDRLRDKANEKEKEKNVTIKKLREVKNSHNQLLEENDKINSELYALKEHADVLENHNEALNKELINFVNADEYARKQLDRKDRFEFLKKKNIEKLRKSHKKLKDSLSPNRIHSKPIRNTYIPSPKQ